MKKFSFVVGLLFVMVAGTVVNAQEITDENLRRYAIMMETVDAMKQEISDQTNMLIKNQEGMDGKRYLELAKTKGDAAQLEAIEAKDYEIKFLEVVTKMQDERKDAISEVVTIMATKMMPDGGKAYKEVKAAVDSDADVKARYEAIKAKIAGAADAGA